MKYKIFFASLTLSGCVSNPAVQINYNDPHVVASTIKVVFDDYRKIRIFTAPNIASLPETIEYKANKYMQGDFPESSEVFLRAIKSTDIQSTTIYQLYIASNYMAGKNSWKFYNEARDSNGTKLNMSVINRDIDHCGQYGCRLIEKINISLTKEELENYRSNGIKIKLYAKNGTSQIYYVSSGYVEGFLTSLQ